MSSASIAKLFPDKRVREDGCAGCLACLRKREDGPSPFGKHVRSTYAQEAKEAPFRGNTYGDLKV